LPPKTAYLLFLFFDVPFFICAEEGDILMESYERLLALLALQ